jgi:hypothetical protein
MPEDIRRALAGVEITELYGDGEQIGQLKKVRFAQKVPALDSLARYLGMFQVGAVASVGLHISLHLGEGPDEPKPAIAAPALPVATYRLSGIPCARVRERSTERRRFLAGSPPAVASRGNCEAGT